MSHVLPYPTLLATDASYVSKMQANLDYVRDLIVLPNLGTAETSSTAGFSDSQIAQYGVKGSSLGTGADGVPTAAYVAGSVGDVATASGSISDGKLATTIKLAHVAASGIWVAYGVITGVTLTGIGPSSPYSTSVTIDASSVGMTSIDQADAGLVYSSDPGKPISVLAYPSGLTISILVCAAETLGTIAGAAIGWIGVGT